MSFSNNKANSIENKFYKATEEVHNLHYTPDDEDLLILYGLYKQATIGDNNNDEPWKIQFQTWRKWNAWEKNFGLSKKNAMIQYIEYVKWLQEQ